jgi:hypothetical protein
MTFRTISSVPQTPAYIALHGIETIQQAGSGLVFNNTYDSGVSSAYRDAIVQAENFLQQHFTDSVTFNVEFKLDKLTNKDGTPDLSFVAHNDWSNAVTVGYDQLKAALIAHATTADDLAAVASLPKADPSHGAQWQVPVGMAINLGLEQQGDPSKAAIDDVVTLNGDFNWSFGDDAIGVILHEMTEGLFGRTSEMGLRSDGFWQPLDLFRYAAGTTTPKHDYTGGHDGKAAYFSIDGKTLLTQFHDPISTKGADDGQDFADWNGTGDAFGVTEYNSATLQITPGAVTDTDLRVLDILGWTPTAPSPYRIVQKQVAPGAPFHGQGEIGAVVKTASLHLTGQMTAGGAAPDLSGFDSTHLPVGEKFGTAYAAENASPAAGWEHAYMAPELQPQQSGDLAGFVGHPGAEIGVSSVFAAMTHDHLHGFGGAGWMS